MRRTARTARAARDDATRLRSESLELKLAVRGNLARSRDALGEAQLETESGRRAIPCASPWSGLHWLVDDESLERILLPID